LQIRGWGTVRKRSGGVSEGGIMPTRVLGEIEELMMSRYRGGCEPVWYVMV